MLQDKNLRLGGVGICIYEGHLKSSWSYLITPSRNFVEVR
jgi:hypothetical protein